MSDIDDLIGFALEELDEILDEEMPDSPTMLIGTQAVPDRYILSTVAVSSRTQPMRVKRRPSPGHAEAKCLQGKPHTDAPAIRGVRFDVSAQPADGHMSAAHRRTGSSHGRSTIDSLAAWGPGGRGSGAGEVEAAALAGPPTPQLPLPRDNFEFSAPRTGYGVYGDVQPRRRRETEASLAEWVANAESEAGDEAAGRSEAGAAVLGGPAPLQGIAEAWLASDTHFLHCDFQFQPGTVAVAQSAAAARGGGNAGGRGGCAWWRQPLVRWGITLAAFAGGFTAASLGCRRLRRGGVWL